MKFTNNLFEHPCLVHRFKTLENLHQKENLLSLFRILFHPSHKKYCLITAIFKKYRVMSMIILGKDISFQNCMKIINFWNLQLHIYLLKLIF